MIDKVTPVSVCILSLSNVAEDSRVLRLIHSFAQHGWDVHLIGLQGNHPTPELAGFYPVQLSSKQIWRNPVSSFVWTGNTNDSSHPPRWLRVFRFAKLAAARLWPESVIRRFSRWGRFVKPVEAILEQLPPCQLVFAVDWNMLPSASHAQQKWGATLVYDSHEYAREEFAERWDWFLFERPSRMVIENNYIRNATMMLSVSEPISEALQRIYQLPECPLTVRNIPIEPSRTSSSDTMSRFLYVGRIGSGRKLHDLITSLPGWQSEQTLTLMGPGYDSPMARELLQLAADLGVADKLFLRSPVPPNEIVQVASQYDVGIILLSQKSKQNQWCLPNKLFEYLAAGLAVLATDLPEIRQILIGSHAGILLKNNQPATLASAMCILSKTDIRQMKENAVDLAKTQSWKQEIMPIFAHPAIHERMTNATDKGKQ